jgi:predicted O-methyltransferase YrrM
VLEHHTGMAAIMAPHVNAYKRLQPDMLNGYWANWGHMEVIPELDGTFDLIYLDADKENYCNYFDLLIEKVNPGGYLLADNVLWSGKVLEDSPNKLDRETLGIKEFNQKVHNDQRVENVLLPIRDGLMLLRKNL